MSPAWKLQVYGSRCIQVSSIAAKENHIGLQKRHLEHIRHQMSFSGENSVIPLSDSDQEIGESRAISYDPRWGSDRVKASYIRPYHTLPRIL